MGCLIVDFVSPVTWPDLARLSPTELNVLATHEIQSRNFFAGRNPFALRTLVECDVWFGSRISSPQLSSFWSWDLGPKQMAVAAITFRKV